jgi:AraC-like DNA-binding protein
MPLTPIVQLLQNKILPFVADGTAGRVIVARGAMEARHLPAGVKIERQKTIGRRVIVKSRRLYANARHVQARWPVQHLHETTSMKLVCVTRGRVAYPVGNALLHIPAGFFIFVPAGVPHSDGSVPIAESSGDSCELFYMTAYPDAVHCWGRLAGSVGGGDPCENLLVRESKTVNLFRVLTEEAVEEGRDPEIMGHLMQALFQMLLRDLLAGRFLQTSLAPTHEKPTEESGEFSATLRDYISHHLHLPLTLEMAASHMFLSRAQFARRIKQETGKTFGEILTEHRLENAKILLRESEWTAAIIAEMIGLKSAAYFNHLFARHTGSTPGRYRHIARKSKARK